ncbi:MAG: hypothetical protein RI953_2178 [Pseudomonadota bacterium]|jgi:type II secretory pathway pseudopilin PulG
MVSTAPKNSRNKRLHVVFFTDASKTKSTSISIRNLSIVVGVTVGFFAAAAASLYLYRQNKATLSAKDDYIRELKSAITSFAVTNEKNQLAMANEAAPETDLTRRVAKEIQNPSVQEKRVAASGSDDTLASLQMSLSSLSSVSANLARNDKNEKNQPVDFTKSNSGSDSRIASSDSTKSATQKGPDNAAPNTEVVSSAPTNQGGKLLNLTGIQVEQGHATEVNGQTTVHFQLVNISKSRGQSWTGRVCGVAELASGGAAPVRGAGGFMALPGGFKVDSARYPSNSCADGELVRFSRLRPTELVVPAKQDAIKRVTIFFVESGSNRTLSQPIEF